VAGNKTIYDQTYLTPRTIYREDVGAADTSPIADAAAEAIPAIRLDLDSSSYRQDPDTGERTCYPSSKGYNGRLALFVQYDPPGGTCDEEPGLVIGGILDDADSRCHVTLQVWAYGGIEGDGAATVEAVEDFYLVHEFSVLSNTLEVIPELPAAPYVVTVSFISEGTVTIIEAHTE
jgi:hypothetical protein